MRRPIISVHARNSRENVASAFEGIGNAMSTLAHASSDPRILEPEMETDGSGLYNSDAHVERMLDALKRIK